MVSEYKPCNRVVTNYCYNITQNYLGYLTGVDISYTSEQGLGEIQEILKYNDTRTTDTDLLKNALIFGVAYEIAYMDEDKKQRFKVLDSREVIPVYTNDLNMELVAAIRFYPADPLNVTKGNIIEVYDKDNVYTYNTNEAYASLSPAAGPQPHYHGQVPITVFKLNNEEESVFDKIMTLQDAYNNLLSAELDDFQAFCDAYLVLKGCTADDEDIKTMRENRVLILDAEAGAEYLNKNINDTQVENILENLNAQIHKIAASPDFSDENFGTSSGIALRYRLLGFENTAAGIVANMTKALQRRIELICDILALTGGSNEATWRDIEIVFKRNLPIDNIEAANMVNTLRGVVSDKTLLSQLPFVADAERELELLQKQTAEQMQLYNFPALASEGSEGGEV